MKDNVALGTLTAAWALLGVSLADVLVVVQIVATVAATAASVAAAIYYSRKK